MNPYPPYQMNQTQAARYCGISTAHFVNTYRTQLPYREEGGNVYFLKEHIERLLHKKFREDGQWPDEREPYQASTDTSKQASGTSTKLSEDTDAFAKAVKQRTIQQQKDAQLVG